MLDEHGRPYQSDTPGTLGGYRRSRIYGRLGCPSALRSIAKGQYVQHRVIFANEEVAVAAGYRPCGSCLRPNYRQWLADTEARKVIRETERELRNGGCGARPGREEPAVRRAPREMTQVRGSRTRPNNSKASCKEWSYSAVMERTPFVVPTSSGELSGWVTGAGRRVLAVHGGPGINYGYLDDAVAELAGSYEVATYQQRGLAPSTEQGEFTVAEAVADIAAVLDRLGWEKAFLMGHSWGGHLVLHAAAFIPERLLGVLSIDPLGAVGDGGAEAFNAEIMARVPETLRARARELDEKDTAGEATPAEVHEAFALVWRSYFADPTSAPPMPEMRFAPHASQGLWKDLMNRLPELEASLAAIRVPVGVVVGELSPMPPSAGIDSAERIPSAWSHIEPGAGHFIWHESPGCLRLAMDRLVAGT